MPQLRRQQRHLSQRIKPSMTKILVGAFFLFTTLGAADEVAQLKPPEHVRNFGQVDQNILRGGMPTDEALQELKNFGVKMILDLRQDGPASLHEKEVVEHLGMRYEHLPLHSVGAPTANEIKQALALLLGEPSGKVYVHCLRGKDRTGTVVACYRIQHDGWDNQRALSEAKSYGMSSLERQMQAFIRGFTPLKFP
jgi:tyrosine-protein phosphatase SIW14